MDRKSNAYVVTFAVTVCAISAVCLSAAYNTFAADIAANELFDQQKNVLIAVGLYERTEPKSDEELRNLYDNFIEEKVLQVKREDVERPVKQGGVEGTETQEEVVDMVETEYLIADLAGLRREEGKKPEVDRREFATVFRRKDDAGATVAWCIPISGYGLWSTLYGFLALEPDLATVKGITFYKHAETPGLGGEVDNVNWQAQWPGKSVLDAQGNVVGVQLKKGVVDSSVAYEKSHMVDGLSGATITSNGVTKFVKSDLERYEPFFKKNRTE
ncbi:MAG: NADH:ubiquinone reductase (Na(+)-transporting) subunit C [Planctomycetota bacterium]